MNDILTIAFEKINLGVIIIDRKQNIVFWNYWLEKYTGILSRQAVGKNIVTVIPLFEKSYYQQIFYNALYKGQGMFCSGAIHSIFVPYINTAATKQGRQNMLVEPLSYQGEPYVLLQVNDITTQYNQAQMLKEEIRERKKVEKVILESEEDMKILRNKALQASKAKSTFLRNMSHEIRTPMNSIVGMTELLDDLANTEEQKEYLTVLQRNCDNLLKIVDTILDLAVIESGNVELRQEKIDVFKLLMEMAEIYRPLATQKGLKLKLDTGDLTADKVFILGNEDKLKQVLNNLIGNAIKFTHQGEILLKATVKDEKMVCIIIKDTGIGIPAEKIEMIFESFEQVEQTTTRKYSGAGLGLTISRRIIDLMDGQIWAESKERVGTTFYIQIPYI